MACLILDELSDNRNQALDDSISRPTTKRSHGHFHSISGSNSLPHTSDSNRRTSSTSAQPRTSRSAESLSSAFSHASSLSRISSSAVDAAHQCSPPDAKGKAEGVQDSYIIYHAPSISVGGNIEEGAKVTLRYTPQNPTDKGETCVKTKSRPASVPKNRHQPRSSEMPVAQPGSSNGAHRQASEHALNDTNVSVASADDRLERSSVNGHILDHGR